MYNTEPRIYTVTELTRKLRNLIRSSEFQQIWVEGEITNVRRPTSGYYYFDLIDKNGTAKIKAVAFNKIAIEPANGMLAQVFGDVNIYERDSVYQIVVRDIKESGRGALLEKFEKLKEKLQKEGLFDASRKRPIPMLPQHIGVVTSSTGAAIRDILNVLSRRFYNLHILIAPVKVQGEGAAEEIAEAIKNLNQYCPWLDVIIVGRGGGSLEDLWCFNEEIVARAIVSSKIPIISAVGHEIDFTISDFVADLRAPTPSAAAELVVNQKDAFEEKLVEYKRRIDMPLRKHLLVLKSRLQTVSKSYVFSEPRNLAMRFRQQISNLKLRMEHELETHRVYSIQRMDDVRQKIFHIIQLSYQSWQQKLRRLETHLNALSPLAVLHRGYSITYNDKGKIIRTIKNLQKKQYVKTLLAEGMFESEITAINKEMKHIWQTKQQTKTE